MRIVIKIVSIAIIIFGLLHIYCATCRTMDTDTLWFIGSGFAIIFPGILNLVALDRGGSRFTLVTALIVNVLVLLLFCFALFILNELQVYIGIAVFLISSIGFAVQLMNSQKNKGI